MEKMLIDGQAAGAEDGRTIDVENPANRTVIAQVPRAGAADVDRAVEAAARAFDAWRAVPPRERGRMLLRIADAVEAETDAVARLVARRHHAPGVERTGGGPHRDRKSVV